MLTFAESTLRELEKLKRDTEDTLLNGGVDSMERYRFLMGRLEGIKFATETVRVQLNKYTDSDF
jgi:hypothetical protein